MRVGPHARSLGNEADRSRIYAELAVYKEQAEKEADETVEAVFARSERDMSAARLFYFLVVGRTNVCFAVPRLVFTKKLGYVETISASAAGDLASAWDDALKEPDAFAWTLSVGFSEPLLYADLRLEGVKWPRPASLWARLTDWRFNAVPPAEPLREGDLVVYFAEREATIDVRDRTLVWSAEWGHVGRVVAGGLVESKLGVQGGVFTHPPANVTPDYGTHYIAWRPPAKLVKPPRLRNVMYRRQGV